MVITAFLLVGCGNKKEITLINTIEKPTAEVEQLMGYFVEELPQQQYSIANGMIPLICSDVDNIRDIKNCIVYPLYGDGQIKALMIYSDDEEYIMVDEQLEEALIANNVLIALNNELFLFDGKDCTSLFGMETDKQIQKMIKKLIGAEIVPIDWKLDYKDLN